MSDQLFQLAVELWEVRVGGDGVKGGVVPVVTLVLPDVDWKYFPSVKARGQKGMRLQASGRYARTHRRYHNRLLLSSSFQPDSHGSVRSWPSLGTMRLLVRHTRRPYPA